jgi:hypothetical protein
VHRDKLPFVVLGLGAVATIGLWGLEFVLTLQAFT